ncbi:glycosyltransferase [Thermococcus sp.]|uniref:glycosyltransferase n=1 Tax=Thermococcus sp. TaxID=35749 RepID=UPI00261D629F|nr:glycosyltransferase [Thermococcus sp.]
MKVCLIVRRLNTKAGGIAVYTRNLIRTLERGGHEVELSPCEGVSYLLWQFFKVPLWLVRSGCDTYHAVGVIEGITLPLFKPQPEKRITVHDLIPLKHPRNGLKGLFERLFIRLGLLSARKCDVIYAVSHLTKVDLVRFGVPEDKIKVVRQPIDERFLREPPKAGKFREPGRFILGYISRMDYHKRHTLLVELFKRWDNPNARLLLAGTGEEFERVKRLAEGDDRIKLLGFIRDEELIEFYDSLDVYVHASKYEGWGLPIVEAIARGKPVVVFEDAEIPGEVKGLCLGLPSKNSCLELNELFKNRKLVKKFSILNSKAGKNLFR